MRAIANPLRWMLALAALVLVVGVLWWTVDRYWIWGYTECEWPADASIHEPLRSGLPEPRRIQLHEKRWSALGGPRLLAVLTHPETGEEICRCAVAVDPGAGNALWLEPSTAGHWGPDWGPGPIPR